MKKLARSLIFPLVAAIIMFGLGMVQPFASLDGIITDSIYSQLRNANKDFVIICVDSETLEEYGSFTSWSREKIGELINLLYQDEENAPMLVALDFIFQGDTEPDTDAYLADSCSGNDRIVVAASDMVISGKLVTDASGNHYYDSNYISMEELPYDALKENVYVGFANAFTGTDGVDRYSKAVLNYIGEERSSFAWQIAKLYAKETGTDLNQPASDGTGLFRFFYAEPGGEYTHVSLKQVLNGNIPLSEFRDKVVFVGAYAAGMQDSYEAAADTEGIMFGVEIQANIVQAMLDGATAVPVSKITYSIVSSVFIFIVCFLAQKLRLLWELLITASTAGVSILVGRLLSQNGYTIVQLPALIVCTLLILYFIIRKYILEAKKRRKVMNVFSKYMEPKLVEKLARDDTFEMKLGGEKRDVAVLFVDIRGFTAMSEKLEPEQVVQLLNEYLGLVTDSIFRHHGMLDKFIGDAAMAVFNAPADLNDYLYEAVAAAWDIAQGSKPLSEKLMQQYGRTVSYGIGVNCGPAVVGNIGCDFRMDYTAIGDTVNTASRLEGKAGKGEILISEKVNEALTGRIETEKAGDFQLKGKEAPVPAYRVLNVLQAEGRQ